MNRSIPAHNAAPAPMRRRSSSRVRQAVQAIFALVAAWLIVLGFAWGGWAGEAVMSLALMLWLALAAALGCNAVGSVQSHT